jgi:hypothetical protein
MVYRKKLWRNCRKNRVNKMENSNEIIKKKEKYIYTKSTYNPKLDHLKGEIIFKEKFEQVKEILSKIVFPKEVLDIINKDFSK